MLYKDTKMELKGEPGYTCYTESMWRLGVFRLRALKKYTLTVENRVRDACNAGLLHLIDFKHRDFEKHIRDVLKFGLGVDFLCKEMWWTEDLLHRIESLHAANMSDQIKFYTMSTSCEEFENHVSELETALELRPIDQPFTRIACADCVAYMHRKKQEQEQEQKEQKEQGREKQEQDDQDAEWSLLEIE